ncbi:MAG TPA: histidine kinase [Casimicrobiaceae bacterium]|nr:histidine kinase [Casimicrobiaceae bacterium]
MTQTVLAASQGLRPHPPGAIKRALGRVTPQVVVATFAIAFALGAWSLYDAAYGAGTAPAQVYLSSIIVNVLIAFSMMFTTFVADEFVSVGAPPLPVYASGILAGSALGSLGQWLVHEALRRTPSAIPGLRIDAIGVQSVFVFFEYLIWGSIGVWIYVNRRRELRAKARMNASGVQRAQMQRRSLEAQLQTLQTQVEPQFLLDMLGRARDRYAVEPARGSASLAALIAYLRNALPHHHDAASDLGREVDLARSYVNMMQEHLGLGLVFRDDVPEPLRASRLPAMLMLPIMQRIVGHRRPASSLPRTINICANVAGEKVRVAIVHDGNVCEDANHDADLVRIRTRLFALYGDHATLTLDTRSATLEVPFESPDGRHR